MHVLYKYWLHDTVMHAAPGKLEQKRLKVANVTSRGGLTDSTIARWSAVRLEKSR